MFPTRLLPNPSGVHTQKITVLAAFLLIAAADRLTAGESFAGQPVFSTDKGQVQCAQSSEHIDCLSIPYAAPPIAELRLRAPAEARPWSGTRDATRFAPVCIQAKTEYEASQMGSEDCLYVNVYIPGDAKPSTALPVMVWLHGGGFINGSGNAFNGTTLARTANAIVVTVNYRLGPFGWLALPSLAKEAKDGSTGDYGLL